MMEVFETLEDEFDEYFDRITTPRRNPVFQNRTNYMETLDETDFRTRFRLTKEAVMFVYSMIEETISAPTESLYNITFILGGDNAEEWRDRKSQFSFNVQTVVSAKLKILDIVVRWPGAAHDQTIFNNSFLKQRLINGEFGNLLIVGDKGYENTSYLHSKTPRLQQNIFITNLKFEVEMWWKGHMVFGKIGSPFCQKRFCFMYLVYKP
ncbi:unnamed protein product [Pieris macdunnoughi]|uniref:DDE Tnp4 domain-containing protein n=1 Tax=Pieris macdunnoughi TaxID=345717 RepID=A0A821S3B7_9NEOP|nr:unnamed protein product [Pieris macdunnoughi]